MTNPNDLQSNKTSDSCYPQQSSWLTQFENLSFKLEWSWRGVCEDCNPAPP